MKKIVILMIMMGFAGISACASNEAEMEQAENDVEMVNDKADAEAARARADAEEAKARAADAAAQAEADAEAEKEKADAEAAQQIEMASDEASDSSDNKIAVCEKAGQVRTIMVVYNDETSENICQVDYEKSTGVQTLWTAIMDKDYCLEQAEAFVLKQEGWGWACSALQ